MTCFALLALPLQKEYNRALISRTPVVVVAEVEDLPVVGCRPLRLGS
jgi:hypothetical protein